MRGQGQGLRSCAGNNGAPPWTRGTHSGLLQASGSKGGREKGGLLGSMREGQAGRRQALTSSVLPPCSCKAFCSSSTCALSSDSCCWFSLTGKSAQCWRLVSNRARFQTRRQALTVAVLPAHGVHGWPPPGGAAIPPVAPGPRPPAGTVSYSPAEDALASL